MEYFEQKTDGLFSLRVPFPGCWTGVVLALGPPNVLVDSGGCAETVDTAVLPALRARGMTLSDIDWLVLTHTHGDHVGGAARLKELAPKMQIAAFADSVARVADPLAYSRKIRERFPKHSPQAPVDLTGVHTDRPLRAGDTVGPLRLYHTPGHDTDSCSFLDLRTNTLITGDSLQLNGTVAQGCALLMDVPAYEKTLRRLIALDPDNLVCGHPYLPLGDGAAGKAAVRRYLAACLACYEHDRAFIVDMAAAGETDPAYIARALIANISGTEPKHLFLPMHTVAGYLAQWTGSQTQAQ